MGLFSGMFGNSESSIPWIDLQSGDQLNDILNASDGRLKVIFKHSTRCGISSMAKGRLEADFDDDFSNVDMYYLDLLAFRPISNEIADRLNIVHQSPQLILLRDGEVLTSTSHEGVQADVIRDRI